MRFSLSLSLFGLATLIAFAFAFALAGSAYAHRTVHPAQPVSTVALRAVADRYRSLTWKYERAAHVKRTPTSYSYRRSTDPAYLQWTIETWTRRSYHAREAAVAHIHHALQVRLPKAPRIHASLSRRLAYTRQLTLKLRGIYPGTVTRGFARARARTGSSTLRLWQERSAIAALLVSEHGYARPPVPASFVSAFTCIHHYEGAWDAVSDTIPRYYGGLQMDLDFQNAYGSSYLRQWGTADHWPVWAQIAAAVRAYRSGRGFHPWPYTAQACGLL